MGVLNYIGVLIVVAVIIGVGLLSGRKVKSASDFATGGGKSGAWMVCGTIMGALVGSQASIGTAQLAFHFGAAAWWFTLGSGIGCLLLAVAYVKPLRRTGVTTLMGVLEGEYGKKPVYIGSVLSSIGIFISVLAQVVACTGLVTVIFHVPMVVSAIISVALMMLYVVAGGARGAGAGGIVKLVLLYTACIVGLVVVWVLSKGPAGLLEQIKGVLVGTDLGAYNGIASAADIPGRYTRLTARGVAKDLGSGLSLLLGVLSTQSYAQAIWSGKSDRSARRGALLSTFLIPPIGIAGIAVGMFMRGQYITQAELNGILAAGGVVPEGMKVLESTILVFPTFVVEYLPNLVAGGVLGTLLVTVVAGGAGLSLGVSTILVNDIYKKLSKRFEQPKTALIANRLTIVVVLIVSACITCVIPSATINDFGFLSMGLRGAVVFIPLTCALFLPGRIPSRAILLCVILGPLGVLGGKLLGSPIDPLFIGMAVALLVAAAGGIIGRRKGSDLHSDG